MDLLLHEFGRNLGDTLRTSLRPPIFDRDGATLNPAEFTQSLGKSSPCSNARQMSSAVGAGRRRTEFACPGLRSVVRCGRCRACLCIGRRTCQSKCASKEWSGYAGHCGCRLGSMTPKRAGRRTGATLKNPKETLRLQKSEPRNRGNDLFCAPEATPLSRLGVGRIRPVLKSTRTPSVPRARADRGGRLFSPA